jgi:hypothetical protein
MFSLRALFLVVTGAALAAASLFANTFWLISVFVVLTLGILCWAILERQEAFWRGLCLFGTVYLFCAVLPMYRTVSDMLPSTRVYEVLIERDENPLDNPFGDPPPEEQGDPFGQPLPIPLRAAGEYWPGKRLVLHCSAALLFGTVGGLLLQWNAQRKKASA